MYRKETTNLTIKINDIPLYAVSFIICLFSTTSSLINYIIPVHILQTLLVFVVFGIEILFCFKRWEQSELIYLLYMILLAIFPVASSDSVWGITSTVFYLSSLFSIGLIMIGKWKIDLAFKFMLVMYTMYAICTIVFYFTPTFYKETVVNLFPTAKSDLLWTYNDGSMPGLTDHYSTNGMFLAAGFIMSAALYLSRNIKFRKKIFSVCICMLFAVAILMSGKRAHLLFSFAAAYVIYYVIAVTKSKGKLNGWIKSIGIIIIVLVILTILITVFPALSQTFDRIKIGLDSGNIDNNRFYIWSIALHVFSKNPILGIGWKAFSNSYGYGAVISGRAYDAHNTYIQLLCETGIVGFLLYIIWFIMFLLKGIKQLRNVVSNQNSTQMERYVMSFALGYQIFFLLYCITGNPLYEQMTYVPYFFSCGITLYFERKYQKLRKGISYGN